MCSPGSGIGTSLVFLYDPVLGKKWQFRSGTRRATQENLFKLFLATLVIVLHSVPAMSLDSFDFTKLSHLKPKGVKTPAWNKLMNDITYIFAGLKPALLVDNMRMSVALACDICRQLKAHAATSNLDIVVIILLDDIMFANRDLFAVERLRCRTADSWLVNTAGKSKISGHDTFNTSQIPQEFFDKLVAAINHPPTETLSVIDLKNLTSMLSVPAIFGIILGYPFIYNLTDDSHTVDTEVVLFQLSRSSAHASRTGNNRRVISSFSVPSCLGKELDIQGIAQRWFESILTLLEILSIN